MKSKRNIGILHTKILCKLMLCFAKELKSVMTNE